MQTGLGAGEQGTWDIFERQTFWGGAQKGPWSSAHRPPLSSHYPGPTTPGHCRQFPREADLAFTTLEWEDHVSQWFGDLCPQIRCCPLSAKPAMGGAGAIPIIQKGKLRSGEWRHSQAPLGCGCGWEPGNLQGSWLPASQVTGPWNFTASKPWLFFVTLSKP